MANKLFYKLKGSIPDPLRYNHYIHKGLFVSAQLWAKAWQLLFKDRSIDPSFISLSVGTSLQLGSSESIGKTWTSDSIHVAVNAQGYVLAREDALGKESQATITESDLLGKLIKEYHITIVPWKSNLSRLEIISRLPGYKVLAYHEGIIFFSIGKDLYQSRDGFLTKRWTVRLPVLPAGGYPMLITKRGFFLIGQKQIFHSLDLKNWDKAYQLQMHGNIDMFDHYYDQEANICYVYVGEYSCNNAQSHNVYRGTVHPDGRQDWRTILSFDSIEDYRKNKSLLTSARHVHIVKVDQATGDLWVGTGDEDIHCRIMLSRDHGDSFQIIGRGSQEWRTLSIWFSQNYAYWNMDSHEPQKIFRLARTAYQPGESAITPQLASGYTKPGLKYLVEEPTDIYRFPARSGEIYLETEPRALDKDNFVIALNDSQYDKREIVAELSNGAQFGHCWVKNGSGEELIIMASAPEGNLRDMQGRIFGIKENSDGSTDVQELISVHPKNPGASYSVNMFTQLVPLFQDQSGLIYLQSRNLSWPGIYIARLFWRDQDTR
jgi:hypothetical protein